MKIETIEQFMYRNHTDESAKSYMFNIEHYLTLNPEAKAFKYKDVLEYMNSLEAKYPSSSTRNTILAAIKRYYDYLVETEQREDHPCRKLRVISRGKHIIQHQNLFSSAELSELLNREERFPKLAVRNKVTRCAFR